MLLTGVLLGVLTAPALASASCPPLTGGGTWFERLQAAAAEGRGPTSPRDVPDWMRRENIPYLTVTPSSGPAPLAVEVRWTHQPFRSPTRITLDVDGDGRPEAAENDYGQFRHTYDRPGDYELVVTVEGAGGPVRIPTRVRVMTAADFDQDLQSRWATFKAALGRGDVPAALECLSSRGRRGKVDALNALAPEFRRDVDAILTSIRLVKHRGDVAIYEMRRPDPQGRELSYHVQFVVDADGVWRLDAF